MTTPTPGPGEVTGLSSAQAYATDMTHAYASAASEAESFAAGLGGSGVSGPAVAAVGRAQELTAQAGEAWAAAHAALDQQNVVRDAYAAAPEAGSKDFVTDGAAAESGPATPDGGQPQSDEPSAVADSGQDDALTEDEIRDRDYEAAATLIKATNRSDPPRTPAGQDLQIRVRGTEAPWVSLPVRATWVCRHEDTVCTDCLPDWEADHDLKVAEVPVSVDLDAHKASADEFYTFEGELEFSKPPYWVARHGLTITSQITGQPVDTKLVGKHEYARAEFADGCCDPTPGAPGEIRIGDTIEIVGERERGRFVITDSAPDPDGGYTVAGTDEDGQPFSATLSAWQYEITRRPVAAAQ